MRRARTWAGPALLLAYAAFLLFGAHRRAPAQADRDGYFHARYAQLLPSRGLSRSFAWTQASTWRDRFCDKEFLYHVLLVPFTRDREEPVRGARLLAVLLGVAVFGALHALLAAHGVPRPLLWTAALACMGGPFLLRLSLIRAHVLSVSLLLAGLHFMLRGRWRPLAALGFLYAWSYSVPLVLAATALAAAAGRRLAGERWDLRPAAAALGGTALGLLLHPYSPHSLESLLTYFDVTRLAYAGASASGLELGQEFAPYSTRAFLQAYPLLAAAVLGLGVAGWRAGRRLGPEAMAAYCAALFWFVMTLVFARCVEYAAPLAVAACALAWRDAPPERVTRGQAAALAALLLLAHARSAGYLVAMTSDDDPPRFRGAAEWMERGLAPGETVVNLWWDDFPDLFYDAWRQNYLVGLDPTYMLRWDRDKALRLEAMRTGRAALDRAWLAEAFGARVMVLRTPAVRLYPQLVSGEWRPLYADPYAAVFPLKD